MTKQLQSGINGTSVRVGPRSLKIFLSWSGPVISHFLALDHSVWTCGSLITLIKFRILNPSVPFCRHNFKIENDKMVQCNDVQCMYNSGKVCEYYMCQKWACLRSVTSANCDEFVSMSTVSSRESQDFGPRVSRTVVLPISIEPLGVELSGILNKLYF